MIPHKATRQRVLIRAARHLGQGVARNPPKHPVYAHKVCWAPWHRFGAGCFLSRGGRIQSFVTHARSRTRRLHGFMRIKLPLVEGRRFASGMRALDAPAARRPLGRPSPHFMRINLSTTPSVFPRRRMRFFEASCRKVADSPTPVFGVPRDMTTVRRVYRQSAIWRSKVRLERIPFTQPL